MSRYPDDWDTRRREVYRRDDYNCQDCGASGGHRGNAELHAHHKVPVSRGGSHDYSNLTTLCQGCHERVHGHRIPGGSTKDTESTFKYGIHNIGDYLPTGGETDEVEDSVTDELSLIEMRVGAVAVTVVVFVLLLPFWWGVIETGSIILGLIGWGLFMIILGIPLAFVAYGMAGGVYFVAFIFIYPLSVILPDQFYNFGEWGSRSLPNEEQERSETRSLVVGCVVIIFLITLLLRYSAPFLGATLIASVFAFFTYMIARLYYCLKRFAGPTPTSSSSDTEMVEKDDGKSSKSAENESIRCDSTNNAIKAPSEQANDKSNHDGSNEQNC